MVYETALYVSKGRRQMYSMNVALSFGSEGRRAVWVWHDGDGMEDFYRQERYSVKFLSISGGRRLFRIQNFRA